MSGRQVYEVTIHGAVSDGVREEFADVELWDSQGETHLRADLLDSAARYGLIGRMEAPGLVLNGPRPASRRTLTAQARLRSTQITRVCEDYAKGSRYQNVTLADLCVASGVSERRVRSAFYECYGMSPTAHLRITALNAVRRALLEGPQRRDAVTRAASDFGFWHLSRFAGQYRALFGESPSDTVRYRFDRVQAAAS
jgi:AraC-like DNA-binding protein